MKWKVATGVVTGAFLLLLVAFLLYIRWGSIFGIRHYDSGAVVSEIQRLSELVTVRYTIERVVGLKEPKQPFGEESILIMVQGEALAGVDLANIKPDAISYTGPDGVNIELPPAKLLNTFLNEQQTKVWDRSITWWTPWIAPDPELEHKARMAALEEVRNAALAMGILGQAQKNAETAIRDLLNGLNLRASFVQRPT